MRRLTTLVTLSFILVFGADYAFAQAGPGTRPHTTTTIPGTTIPATLPGTTTVPGTTPVYVPSTAPVYVPSTPSYAPSYTPVYNQSQVQAQLNSVRQQEAQLRAQLEQLRQEERQLNQQLATAQQAPVYQAPAYVPAPTAYAPAPGYAPNTAYDQAQHHRWEEERDREQQRAAYQAGRAAGSAQAQTQEYRGGHARTEETRIAQTQAYAQHGNNGRHNGWFKNGKADGRD